MHQSFWFVRSIKSTQRADTKRRGGSVDSGISISDQHVRRNEFKAAGIRFSGKRVWVLADDWRGTMNGSSFIDLQMRNNLAFGRVITDKIRKEVSVTEWD